ncbi:MAG: YeeE/YedE thiosulfate transporter family protein [Bacteroidota bacterium]
MKFPLQDFLVVSASNPWTYVVFGLIGFGFGFALEMSGFGNSRKLAAQFYFTEMTVLKVMFTAIVTAMVLTFGAVSLGLLDFSQVWVNPTYLGSGIVGGLIMGVGFIVGGFCPTTSIAATATGKIDGMLFLGGGLVGAFLFGETEHLFDNWYNHAGYFGRLTLDQVFGLPTGVVVMLVVLMALFMFWGAEQLERIFGSKDLSREPRFRFAGAVVLVALAASIIFIGQPTLEERYQKITFERQVNEQTVRRSADEVLADRSVFITPAEAYKAAYNQAMNPVYLDVRPESDYNLYHIQDAISLPPERVLDAVPALLTEPAANTVYILMSNDETAAVRAWKQLVASSVPNVYILEGGVNNWISFFSEPDDPALTPDPTAGDDRLRYLFPTALGDRYSSCSPDPIEWESLTFEARIKLQLKRDKSGGGCG